MRPSLEELVEMRKKYNVIPIVEEVIADMDTPLTIFSHFKEVDYTFLLESAENGTFGRYSYLGITPYKIVEEKFGKVEVKGPEGRTLLDVPLLKCVKCILDELQAPSFPDMPDFLGGMVGYLSYDLIREKGIDAKGYDNMPQSIFVIASELIIYDHLKHRLFIVVFLIDSIDLKFEYKRALERIGALKKVINETKNYEKFIEAPENKKTIEFLSNMEREEFMEKVDIIKSHIVSGEVDQVVLSQRFEVTTHLSPFEIYRRLRYINPSPYMFYLNFPGFKIIGSSPESLVKVKGGKVIYRPIAGTISRGNNVYDDNKLAYTLLKDEKERGEHLMLVELCKSDIGKVCKKDSIAVTSLMDIEYFSHVIHMVSTIQGDILPDKDVFDVLNCSLPAGTVSGVPRMKAMDIIDGLESTPREYYGGAVGYISLSGNMDMAISIRTVLLKGQRVFIQAGAGIVRDSVPEKEYMETINKAKAMMEAVC